MRQDETLMRAAWQNMLDPAQMGVTSLTAVEVAAISAFLAATVPKARPRQDAAAPSPPRFGLSF